MLSTLPALADRLNGVVARGFRAGSKYFASANWTVVSLPADVKYEMLKDKGELAEMTHFKSGPDFLCIGMPASGTRWLYDNLQAHGDVMMPLIKELHFLDRGFRSRTLNNRLDRVARRERDGLPIDPRHRAFLDAYAKAPSVPGLPAAEEDFIRLWKHGDAIETPFKPDQDHFAWYEALFAPYRPCLTGDITPGYWRIGPDVIREFHARYPDVRYFAMVRDPVRRTVSSLNKQVHKGLFTLEQARDFIRTPPSEADVIANGDLMHTFGVQASEAIGKWADVVGHDAIKVVALDHVSADADAARADIYAFLGLSDDPDLIDRQMTQNRKENRFPNLLGDADTSVLRERLSDEIEACKALLGDPSLPW